MQKTQLVSGLRIAIVLAAMTGCGGEERGPLQSGGREVRSWVAELHNPKPQVRRQAVFKLGNVGDADPAAAPALAEALDDTDPMVRRAAIMAVVKLQQPGDGIKSQLDTMNKSDKDSGARDLAGKAMERLGKSK